MELEEITYRMRRRRWYACIGRWMGVMAMAAKELNTGTREHNNDSVLILWHDGKRYLLPTCQKRGSICCRRKSLNKIIIVILLSERGSFYCCCFVDLTVDLFAVIAQRAIRRSQFRN